MLVKSISLPTRPLSFRPGKLSRMATVCRAFDNHSTNAPHKQISKAAAAAAAAALVLAPFGDALPVEAATSGGRVSNTSGFSARRQA